MKMNPLNICCLCLRTDKVEHSLKASIRPADNVKFMNVNKLAAAIQEVLTVDSVENETSPKICQNCHTEICQIYIFINRCVRSQKVFNDMKRVNVRLKKLKTVEFNVKEKINVARSRARGRTSLKFKPDSKSKRTQIENNIEKAAFSPFDESQDFADALEETDISTMVQVQMEEPTFLEAATELSFVEEEHIFQDANESVAYTIRILEDGQHVNDGHTTTNELNGIVAAAVNAQPASSIAPNTPAQYFETQNVDVIHCNQCGEEFIDLRLFKAHVRRHLNQTFNCNQCNKRFSAEIFLKNHLSYHHKEKPNMSRSKRNRGKVMKKSVNRPVYRSTKTYACEYCDVTYNRKDSLMGHMRKHTGEYLSCDQCDAKYRFYQSLRLHKIRHTEEKNRIAAKTMTSNLYQNLNLQWETSMSPQEPIINITNSSADCTGIEFSSGQTYPEPDEINVSQGIEPTKPRKMHECNICGKRFERPYILKSHMRLHTGEMLSCDQCDAKYAFLSSLNQHKLKHAQA